MNIELFSYSLQASILGISVVFVSLVGLSLLMILLNSTFSERSKPEPEKTVAPVLDAGTDWIMAAVAVYLSTEAGPPPSASAWTPGASEKTDSWMNRAIFDNRSDYHR